MWIRIRQNEANLNPTTLPEDDIFRIKSGNKDMVPNCLDLDTIRSVDRIHKNGKNFEISFLKCWMFSFEG
jgi:hypothetical protein